VKNIIFVVFLFTSISSFSLSAQAYGTLYPGSILNPIQIQIVPDRLDALIQQQAQDRFLEQMQRNANTQQENNLKSTYGSSNYSYCYSSNCTNAEMDVTTKTRCLPFVQACLKREVIRENYSNNTQQIQNQAPQLTNNQLCQKNYGTYSMWVGTLNAQGGAICGCQTGYQWNDNSNPKSCVVAPIIPVKTDDQTCKDYYGLNSAWTNTLGASGEAICDCQTGYQWNSNRTSCILNTTPLIPGCSSDQGNQGYSATTAISCDGDKRCGVGMKLNSEKSACVPKQETQTLTPANKKELEAKNTLDIVKKTNSNKNELIITTPNKEIITNIEESKPKGFWVRFFGWFGF